MVDSRLPRIEALDQLILHRPLSSTTRISCQRPPVMSTITWKFARGRPICQAQPSLDICEFSLPLRTRLLSSISLSVESFFAYHMHANRLFHVPTFMASLDLLPTDPRFPHVSLLHAMCAVGSLYTGAVPENQIFNDTEDTPCEYYSSYGPLTSLRYC